MFLTMEPKNRQKTVKSKKVNGARAEAEGRLEKQTTTVLTFIFSENVNRDRCIRQGKKWNLECYNST